MSHFGEPRAKKREDRQGGGVNFLLSGGDEQREPESQTSFWSPHSTQPIIETEGQAAEPPAGGPAAALPCLFVTTAPEKKQGEENGPLPGPRKKQADALTENIKWLGKIFGGNRIAFGTLTVGDFDAGGRFRNLRDRKKAQKRIHSLLTHVISKR